MAGNKNSSYIFMEGVLFRDNSDLEYQYHERKYLVQPKPISNYEIFNCNEIFLLLNQFQQDFWKKNEQIQNISPENNGCIFRTLVCR